MTSQQDINWKMRQTLCLWLVQVAQEFQLEQETLYLAFNLLDRIGSCVQILTHQYQLVGLSCLWIASKTEQNHGTVPSLKRLQQMCLNTYTRQEFKAMEHFILYQLQFNITHVSPLAFIDILFELEGNPMGELGVSLTNYLIEISVLHRRFVGVLPYTIARACIGLAKIILMGDHGNDHTHIKSMMYQLMDCLHNQPSTLIKKVN
jgi:G2/mitotic-specific cyclin 2